MCACPRVNACCRCDARLSDGMCADVADVAPGKGVSSLVPSARQSCARHVCGAGQDI